jgi:hypothetical protein
MELLLPVDRTQVAPPAPAAPDRAPEPIALPQERADD